MKKASLIFILFIALIACSKEESVPERPLDPWVFRSVLDAQPRMVTVALHDELYVAYDARYGGLYKAWKGGVNFDGAVYTTKHGPQPTSEGYAYYEDKLTAPRWILLEGNTRFSPDVQFMGYEFKAGQVYFKYELRDTLGRVILVQENPEYIFKEGKNGLSRKFMVSGAPEGMKVAFKTRLTSLQEKNDYGTTGEFQVSSERKKMHPGGSTYTVEGLMILNTGETVLTVYFHPGFDSEAIARRNGDPPTALETPLTEGKELIANSDCMTCHNETKKTVGPAYIAIAERYQTADATVEDLAQKIIAGGKGNWGEVPMTAHPDLKEKEAEKMVAYILSLDNEAPEEVKEEKTEDLMLGVAAVKLQLTPGNEQLQAGDDEIQDGLAANAYIWDDYNTSFKELVSITPPVLSGVVPVVHFDKPSDLGDIQENIYIEFYGYIDIEETSNHVFRLISDDGSRLYLDDKLLIDHSGFHAPEAKDGEIYLQEGLHKLKITYSQGTGGAALSLQWAKHGDTGFSVIPAAVLKHRSSMFRKVVPYISPEKLKKSIPGDQKKVAGVHPAFDLFQARPDDFRPKVGGMDFLSDGRLVICTWDSIGPVYILEGADTGIPSEMSVKRIASGLAEPLGLKVVNDTIYVLQKHELTRLIDHDGDEVTDEYQTVSDNWKVSANFHEFSFGLEYKEGYFYGALALAIMPGGASAHPQVSDRGKVIKIAKSNGAVEFIAHGLRTPNGIGKGLKGELFMVDNQGDWLPSSKIIHVQKDAWYGSRAVDYEGTAGLQVTPPVVWLPQDEIGNSPSTPIYLDVGPYSGQMIHGDVTHGGVKRVFVEKINGSYQGAVFRFIQGLEAGINRMAWSPDGDLYVGGIGNPGNWQDPGKFWYGLQRLQYNGKPVFEPLAISARTNGIEVEFTQPIAAGQGQDTDDYLVEQWYYKPTEEYGGPKLDLKQLRIKSLHMSGDRKKIFLELAGMKPGHVIHFRVINPFISSKGRSLWTTEGWYTMNAIPMNKPGFINPVAPVAANQLTKTEQKEGWKLLFDGKTTKGWRKFKGDKPGTAWKVRNGMLYLDDSYKKGSRIVGGGDLITTDVYENFELKLEWKIEQGGNSGVIYHVLEGDAYKRVWHTGLEMQILDNLNHPAGRTGTHRAGDLYDLLSCRFVTVNPAGQWNRVRIISRNGHVEHWLNGYKVLEFDMHSPEWEKLIKKSKYKNLPDFGKSQKGHIALQDHNDKVWFRNIKIRSL